MSKEPRWFGDVRQRLRSEGLTIHEDRLKEFYTAGKSVRDVVSTLKFETHRTQREIRR